MPLVRVSERALAGKPAPTFLRPCRTAFDLHTPTLVARGRYLAFLGRISPEKRVDRPEPFGLVMIEAIACGTPVLAVRRGAVPDVSDDGLTDYVVDNLEEAVSKVDGVMSLDRSQVRRRFEQRLTAERMAQDRSAGDHSPLFYRWRRRP